MPNSNVSRIQGEITMETVLRLQREFAGHARTGAKNITLYIDSPGGEVEAGLLLHQVISNSAVPIQGVAQGECGSIAFTVLQACSSRCAESDVTFLVHFLIFQTSAVVFYNESAREAVRARHIDLQETIIAKHLERSRLGREKLLELMFRGEKITSKKAQDFGMIDGIVIGSGVVA